MSSLLTLALMCSGLGVGGYSPVTVLGLLAAPASHSRWPLCCGATGPRVFEVQALLHVDLVAVVQGSRTQTSGA